VGKYIVLLPVIIAGMILFIALLVYLKKKDLVFSKQSHMRIYQGIYRGIDRLFYLKGFKQIKQFYRKAILRYVRIKFTDFIIIKITVFLASILFIYMIMLTNNDLLKQTILHEQDYKTELIMRDDEVEKELNIQEKSALFNKEMDVFWTYRDTYPNTNIKEQALVKSHLLELTKKYTWKIDAEIIASRVYYRLVDYNKTGLIYYRLIIGYGLMISVGLDLIFSFISVIGASQRMQELRYLKQQIILLASVEHENFNDLIDGIIPRAKYYEADLRRIARGNRASSYNLHQIYKEISKYADSDSKFFFENLKVANFSDYDAAVREMRQQFLNEQKSRDRYIKKQIKILEVIGLISSILILGAVFAYGMYPFSQQISDFQLLP